MSDDTESEASGTESEDPTAQPLEVKDGEHGNEELEIKDGDLGRDPGHGGFFVPPLWGRFRRGGRRR